MQKMDNQEIMDMKKMILGMFESKAGLRAGDFLPPRWLLQSEIVNLDEEGKYALESAFNELHDSELIVISKIEETQDQKISITQAGVEFIAINKSEKKNIRKQDMDQLNISALLEEILPDPVDDSKKNSKEITAIEFVSLLEKLITKSEQARISLVQELKDFAENGTTTLELINKLQDLT